MQSCEHIEESEVDLRLSYDDMNSKSRIDMSIDMRWLQQIRSLWFSEEEIVVKVYAYYYKSNRADYIDKAVQFFLITI